MKKHILTLLAIFFLSIFLTWCRENKKIIPPQINTWNSISATGEKVEITIDKKGNINTGKNLISIPTGPSSGEIISNTGIQYSFFKDVISFNLPIIPQQWSYHYNNYPIENEIITLTNFTENWYIWINKTTQREWNKCDLYKTNNNFEKNTYSETSRTIGKTKIKTVISLLKFTTGNHTNNNWYGISCFTLWWKNYEIHINDIEKATTEAIFNSLSFK